MNVLRQKTRRWCALGLLVLALGAFGAAATDGLEQNRKLLRQWKQEPEHYARLEHDLTMFWSLPPEERERIRELDRSLAAEPLATRRRLLRALERYSMWLERLKDEDRRRIIEAPAEERLRVIREIRDWQYLQRLPLPLQKALKDKPPEKVHEAVAAHRREELQRRRDAQRPPKPGGKGNP